MFPNNSNGKFKQMDPERILQLLAKRLGHNASEKELAELNELLSEHPAHQYFAEIIQSIEGEKLHYEPASEEEAVIREGWSRLEHALPAVHHTRPSDDSINNSRSITGIWFRRAAIWTGIIALAGGSFFLWKRSTNKTQLPIAITTKQVDVPYGVQVKRTLPDSSQVWLNAGSHISYADNFNHKTREVFLEGEAYFNIKSDPGIPFIVHAGNIIINVLGTEFNIKAYNDENKIEAILIRGKIQVQIAGNPDKKIVLVPNEKLTVINQEFNLNGSNFKHQKELSFQVKEVVPLQTAAPIPEIAWLQDKLAFQNERFSELAKSLERRYNVHIVFKDTLLRRERLNGVFENENIKKALDILQMTTPFQYQISRDTVYLKQ